MSRVNDIINQFDSMSKSELTKISEKLLQMLQSANGDAFVVSNGSCTCRKCDSENIMKYGKDRKGNQRYRCKSCGSTFIEGSGSVMSYSQYGVEVWEKYLVLLLQGASIAKCSKECKISISTAFIWRHKILNALKKDQNNRVLGGTVETDETYFRISFKGNHLQGAFKEKRKLGMRLENDMPRHSFRRGTDNKAKIGNMACVSCAYERGGQSYADVLCIGIPTADEFKYAFEGRIMPQTLVLSDKGKGIKKYFKDVSTIDLVQLQSHKNRYDQLSPPEVNGVFHIQNINNMHHRLRQFINKYNGVATKYLNNYVSLFIWIENYKKINNVDMNKELREYVSANNIHVAGKNVLSVPRLPKYSGEIAA